MGEAILGFVGGLIGVLIGAAISWSIARQQSRDDTKRERRGELLGIVSEFLADTQRIWAIRQSLGLTVQSIVTTERDEAHRSYLESMRDRRLEDFAEMREPMRRAEWNLARIRILAPELAEVATTLYHECSRPYTLQNHHPHEAAQRAAQDAFEADARKAVGISVTAASTRSPASH